MEKITPCLWVDSNAEGAAKFYTAIFKNSKIGKGSRYVKAGHEINVKPAGAVMTIEFELNGHKFTALNGGPVFKFNEAVSFQVACESQEEVDYYWGRLSEGGDPSARQCGWLKDKYGLSWQIVPNALSKWLQDPDANKRDRVMNALLQMRKIEIKELERAFEQS